MKAFPFVSTAHSIIALRAITGLIFVAHAVVRIINATVEQFGNFLESKGFAFGVLIVWILTIYEIVAGLLLVIGIYTRWLALGFMIIILVGIIVIHASLGWFVGEHGTGGMEYSVVLLVALLVIAAADRHVK